MPHNKNHGIFYCFLPIIYFYAINFLVATIFSFFIALTPDKALSAEKIIQKYAFIIQITTYAVMLTCFSILFFFRERKRYDAVMRTSFNIKDFICITLLGVGLFLLTNVVLTIFSGFNFAKDAIQVHDALMNTQSSGNTYLTIFFTAVLAPITEELLFRGLIFNRFRDISTEKHAMLSCALLFGCMHMASVIQAIYACIIGYILAYVYTKYGKILVPIFLHSVFNLTNFLFIGEKSQTFFSTTFGLCIFYLSAVLFTVIGIKHIKGKTHSYEKY